jgi:hypothetical protein
MSTTLLLVGSNSALISVVKKPLVITQESLVAVG